MTDFICLLYIGIGAVILVKLGLVMVALVAILILSSIILACR